MRKIPPLQEGGIAKRNYLLQGEDFALPLTPPTRELCPP